MGKMKELAICIQEIARGDLKTQEAVSAQISGYLNGAVRLKQLSYEAQASIEAWHCGNNEDLSYNAGRFNFSDLVLFNI